ncbi:MULTISPECIES: hypothetical protein [unclassified Duganella]|uniref:hypothetical protein n=1 Tax=unclassified Duganella TaxID=2636909 RepID=UPI000888B7E9|nr:MULTISPECIES: hypothetical protein [unclassified Duganella]SDF63440.1 hypothetical protein SAMN05216320_101824 [Duganella sp. OV458]SDI64996.1 hypothetical protein SAMN05428973_101591 [Duganella sp. OV510]
MPTYVQHAVLGRIPDVFNAEAIWQAPGLSLFSRRPLLRDLLERSPREHKGRAATRCFSHVTLMLPQEEVDDDYHLTRGARARDLAQTLTALHQKDFGDLLGSDQVRYDVMGTEALAPGEIEVKFGHAVYLPAPDEKILYNVNVSRDSAIWHPVCAIYPNQRLALIGGEGGEASAVAQGWPFGPDAALLILNDGPDAPPVVQMRPKDAFDCRYDPRSGYYTVKSLREPQGGQRLLVKIARASALPARASAPTAPSSKPAVWQSRTGAAPIDLTAVPAAASHKPVNRAGESDATYAPVSQQRVSLVALALPRLSRYRDTGAQALELSFDSTLSLSAAAQPALTLAVDSADNLYACTPEGRQPIEAPATFAPVDARTLRLLAAAPEMADRYRAMICLAQPISAGVACGVRFTFGRNSPMLAALRLLDSPRFIKRTDGAISASADRIGLSRTAFSFEAVSKGYTIARQSPTQALYHLDDKLQFVAAIGDAPYLLPHGHHLVAGHYVLRFEA